MGCGNLVMSHRKKILLYLVWVLCSKTIQTSSTGPETLTHNLSKVWMQWFCSSLLQVSLWPRNNFEVVGDLWLFLSDLRLIHRFPEFKIKSLVITPLLFENFGWAEGRIAEDRITGSWSTRSYREVVVWLMRTRDGQEVNTIVSKSRRGRQNPSSCHRRNKNLLHAGLCCSLLVKQMVVYHWRRALGRSLSVSLPRSNVLLQMKFPFVASKLLWPLHFLLSLLAATAGFCLRELITPARLGWNLEKIVKVAAA